MPSVLGLRDLEPLVTPDARRRSTLDVAAPQELARVFWPTRAYERARAVLGQHRFVVLTGPPEMGKTAIARMLALAQLTDGWEAHECTTPAQAWSVFDPGRRQVFVADDAFGSTEYRADAAELWARELGRMLGALDDRHWLIWTSRPAPLKAGLRRVQREQGSEHFPAPGAVLVDAGELDLAEKTLILFRHAKRHGASAEACSLLRSAGVSIVEHPQARPLPVFMLEAWYTSAGALPKRPEPPSIARTWTELHPSRSLLVGGLTAGDLQTLDDWLALAQILLAHDREALKRTGFHDDDQQLPAHISVELGEITDPELRPLAESMLRRIRELSPEYRDLARTTLRRLTTQPADERWWVPQDIDAPPTTEPVAHEKLGFTREDVERVLADL